MRTRSAVIWVWPSAGTGPVRCGTVDGGDGPVTFCYDDTYLARPDASPLSGDLAVQPGPIVPADGLTIAGALNDAIPNAWGRLVIARRLGAADADDVDKLTYLTACGPDRVGALDATVGNDPPREVAASSGLDELAVGVGRALAGVDFDAAVDGPLADAVGVGGARPKALATVDGRACIVKLPAPTDPYPVVGAEAAAMHLASLAGLDVAQTSVTTVGGTDVLCVERFDRPAGRRRQVLSALTLLGLDAMFGRYATYPDLADAIDPDGAMSAMRHEMFARIAFNICVGNTDDHARNHAAFWDGTSLALTPAYDICPHPRAGGVAAQAIAYGRDGTRASRLVDLVDHAGDWALNTTDARDIIDGQLDVIDRSWDDACDQARLTRRERDGLDGTAIVNPYILEDYRRGW